MQLKQEELKQR